MSTDCWAAEVCSVLFKSHIIRKDRERSYEINRRTLKRQSIWNGNKHTKTANEQQSASAAVSQLCRLCPEDTLCFLPFEYLLRTLRWNKKNPQSLHGGECFRPFCLMSGAESGTLPQWCGCHSPLGSLRIWMEALQKLFNVVLSLFMTLFFISSETSAFFLYVTKYEREAGNKSKNKS